MSDAQLEVLLAQWSRGDVAAAEQALVACEPYLRMVIRRQMSARFRAKFDSGDIVQSVCADLLGRLRQADWRFRDADHFRAFLIKAARNRLTDRLRQNRAAVAAECPLAGDGLAGLAATGDPRPSEVRAGRRPVGPDPGPLPAGPSPDPRLEAARPGAGRDRRPDRAARGEHPPHPV
jgi:RNA polymerase sigma-70 factor (ECF subfamily)